LYLLGRGHAGIHTYKLEGNTWKFIAGDSPAWGDKGGWNNECYYSTIQTAVVNNELYLLGRGHAGIHTYKLEGNTWKFIAGDDPPLADKGGWNKEKYYSTIRAIGFKNKLYVFARGYRGYLSKWEIDLPELEFAPAIV